MWNLLFGYIHIRSALYRDIRTGQDIRLLTGSNPDMAVRILQKFFARLNIDISRHGLQLRMLIDLDVHRLSHRQAVVFAYGLIKFRPNALLRILARRKHQRSTCRYFNIFGRDRYFLGGMNFYLLSHTVYQNDITRTIFNRDRLLGFRIIKDDPVIASGHN